MKKRWIFHALAAVTTGLLLMTSIGHLLMSPVDVFAHANFMLIGHLQFLLAAFIFYGFSLVLLRLVPIPSWWSVAYTALSWLFFLWAFYPTQNTTGMMRRIAGTMADYLAAERRREEWHVVAMVVFASIQLVYLGYVMKSVRRNGLALP